MKEASSILEMTENSLEMKQFRQAREMSARASKFQVERQKDWIHGVPNVRSLITYTSLPSSDRGSGYESHMMPNLTLTDVSSWKSTRHSSLDTTNCPERSSNDKSLLQSDEFESPFSGLLRVPSFSFTRPDNVKPQIDISQYLLHSHFEVNGITYFFGGLQSEPSKALKQLGIPRSTDPSLISVHFPCDMPPFVNKEVLMSPYFLRNPCFFVFNPTRSTVHDYLRSRFEEFEPGHFCDMKGTQISEFQVFFCGGFKVNVDKVEFDKDVGRWIVVKSISTNKDGFILDVRKLSFTKISLLSRVDLEYSGRIGTAICSNFSAENPQRKTNIFESLFPSSAAINEYSSKVNTRNATSLSSPASPLSPRSPGPAPLTTTSSHRNTFSQSSSPSLSSKSSVASFKPQDTRSLEDTKAQNLSKRTSVMPNETVPAVLKTNQVISDTVNEPRSSNLGNVAGISIQSKQVDGTSHSHFSQKKSHKASEQSSNHKVPAMFVKPSRFFHRNTQKSHHSHTLAPPGSSSYSHQVKQHRSKPIQNLKSGPVSAGQSDTLRPSTSPLGTSPPREIEVDCLKQPPSRVDTQDTQASSILGKVSHMDEHKNPQHESEKPEAFIFDAETEKSDQKSGISSICIYLFGGFFLVSDLDGRQSFKASNELLKFELIINDSHVSDFHPEALVDAICPQSDTVPGPRGYFAHILTSAELTNEACNIFGPQRRSQLDVQYNQEPVSISDVLSDRSIETEKLSKSYAKHENMNLIVHGGVDHNQHVFGDCFFFNFEKECWIPLETYAFDYYEIPKKPYEDEDGDKLQLETQVDNAKLVDAELRICHHKAMVYWEGDKEYVAFVGGFNNDFLRHHDRIPYESSKFDVSRLAKLLIAPANPNLLRIPVLNIRSQVWKFKRYFYDLTEQAKPELVELLKHDCMKNAQLAISGGGLLIVGKQLTFCHGLVQFVPEKSKDYDSIQQILENSHILLGGHFHLTFPGM